ncbi:Transposase IS4 [Popillia japonica]|uniref:Transposase IS4 n=1 Tax=Popillia japonica TaxID=7064 RepID=A0AAW1JD30_POPJA
MVIRWMDNSEVTIATNYDTIEPMVTVQRFSKEKKKKVGVPQPLAFNNNNYNRYMGGVDLHDNGVANYRIGIRGKKWWWPLWVQCLDSAVVNAWKLHCIVAASKKTKSGGGRYGSNVWIALLSMPGNFIAS